jgi:Zn-dependent protease with chaperone function
MFTRITALIILLAVPQASFAQSSESLDSYLEWNRDGILIVDGQRVQVTPSTKLKGKNVKTPADIPLGFEVKVKGVRNSAGVLVASELEAKPNGVAMFEAEVLQATNAVENQWVTEGRMYEPHGDGQMTNIGKIIETGPKVERVRAMMKRLAPPYVNVDSLRVRVVETESWNASAMGNGAIWVHSGLMDSISDDELAAVLGHELAHYTHEHSRRNAKRAMWGQVIGAGTQAALTQVNNGAARGVAGIATMMSMSAWMSGYSRDLEDQADRVGLRYAHEGGYDVSAATGLWAKFREKYGEQDKMTNFFTGSHSRPSDRIANIERELARNKYRAP